MELLYTQGTIFSDLHNTGKVMHALYFALINLNCTKVSLSFLLILLGRVTMSGSVTCEDCGHSVIAERDSEDIRDKARPTLVIQLKNVTQTQVIYLTVTGVDTRLSARNVDRLAIDNTVIDKLASNSVEVWYAESFSVENTAAVNEVTN